MSMLPAQIWVSEVFERLENDAVYALVQTCRSLYCAYKTLSRRRVTARSAATSHCEPLLKYLRPRCGAYTLWYGLVVATAHDQLDVMRMLYNDWNVRQPPNYKDIQRCLEDPRHGEEFPQYPLDWLFHQAGRHGRSAALALLLQWQPTPTIITFSIHEKPTGLLHALYGAAETGNRDFFVWVLSVYYVDLNQWIKYSNIYRYAVSSQDPHFWKWLVTHRLVDCIYLGALEAAALTYAPPAVVCDVIEYVDQCNAKAFPGLPHQHCIRYVWQKAHNFCQVYGLLCRLQPRVTLVQQRYGCNIFLRINGANRNVCCTPHYLLLDSLLRKRYDLAHECLYLVDLTEVLRYAEGKTQLSEEHIHMLYVWQWEKDYM